MSKYKKYIKKGYEVKEETDSTATFYVPKKFSWTAFILLCLLFNVFGLFGYLIYYSTKDAVRVETVMKK